MCPYNWKNLAHGEVTQRVFDHVFIDCVGERFTDDAESQLLSGIWGWAGKQAQPQQDQCWTQLVWWPEGSRLALGVPQQLVGNGNIQGETFPSLSRFWSPKYLLGYTDRRMVNQIEVLFLPEISAEHVWGWFQKPVLQKQVVELNSSVLHLYLFFFHYPLCTDNILVIWHTPFCFFSVWHLWHTRPVMHQVKWHQWYCHNDLTVSLPFGDSPGL